MSHGLLIAKMSAYGLSNDACEFMSKYLCDRYQTFKVKISNNKSSWKKMLKGIPQGSRLGPFLFIGFMNDFLYFMEFCDLLNYADDNTLSIIRNTENVMQANLTKFQFMMMQM